MIRPTALRWASVVALASLGAIAPSCAHAPPPPAQEAPPAAKPTECVPTKPLVRPEGAAASALEFLQSAMVPWPDAKAETRLVVTTPSGTQVSIYDNALVVLVLEHLGHHDVAGRILQSLTKVQRRNGSMPFSFALDGAETADPYIRSGALAWVGYAITEYLQSAGGPSRDAIVEMAHKIAIYLITRQVNSHDDPRDGLLTGGEGNLHYEIKDHKIVESFTPGEISWASVEHNIDAYFFLRNLGRITGKAAYTAAAERIASALIDRAWDAKAGQFRRAMTPTGGDDVLALDCASWGTMFLAAAKEPARAALAFQSADTRFASRDPKTCVTGHRPYVHTPVFEEEVIESYYAASGIPHSWDDLEAVWAEGSAGVALAALRTGHRERAATILEILEQYRDKAGGLPMFTTEVPFEFDTKPSVAAVAWVEIVRFELESETAKPVVWRP